MITVSSCLGTSLLFMQVDGSDFQQISFGSEYSGVGSCVKIGLFLPASESSNVE